MQARPPETIEKRRLVREASTPASTLPSVGAAATWVNSIPVIRPRSASGVATRTIVLRRTALTKSAAPAPQSGRKAEPDEGHAPGGRGHDHAEPLAPDVRERAGEDRGDERTGVRRRIEEADRLRTAAEVRADGREESHRHPEDHRVRVDEEDPEHNGLATNEAKTLDDRVEARAIGLRRSRQRRQQPDAGERRPEAGDVDQVGAGQADARDDQAGRRRARDRGEVAVQALQRVRGDELVLLDDPGQQRSHRRRAEAEDQRAEEVEQEQRPDAWLGDGGVDG